MHAPLVAPAPYEVVLKLAGVIGPAQARLAEAYLRAVGTHRFTVLYDAASRAPKVNDTTAVAEAAAALPAAARLCAHSFDEVRRAFPMMERRLFSAAFKGPSWLRNTTFGSRMITAGPELALLQAGRLSGPRCAPRAAAAYWSIEGDAAFTGAPRDFFDAWLSDGADLLSTGYMLGGGRYWGQHVHTFGARQLVFESSAVAIAGGERPLPQPLCGVGLPPEAATGAGRTLSRAHRYTRNEASTDLRWGPGRCNVTRGPLFRLIAVERMSSRLLLHLSSLLHEGRFAIGEVFAGSACAAQPWCVLSDWARGPIDPPPPLGALAAAGSALPSLLPARGFRSPAYWFYPARYTSVASWCEACDCAAERSFRSARGRWVHPVGELKNKLRSECPLDGVRHAALERPAPSDQRRPRGRCVATFPQCRWERCVHGGSHRALTEV